jgi:hypothetical protein
LITFVLSVCYFILCFLTGEKVEGVSVMKEKSRNGFAHIVTSTSPLPPLGKLRVVEKTHLFRNDPSAQNATEVA